MDGDLERLSLTVSVQTKAQPKRLTSCYAVTQRAAAIKRRKQIWEALHPAGGNTVPTCLSDGRKAGPQHGRSFATDTCAAAGLTKRAVNEHLSRAEALGDDLLKVSGTSQHRYALTTGLSSVTGLSRERCGLTNRK
ncbi:MAG: hypothetical protein ACYCWC_12640 [Rhodocyclaceae bacterium]